MSWFQKVCESAASIPSCVAIDHILIDHILIVYDSDAQRIAEGFRCTCKGAHIAIVCLGDEGLLKLCNEYPRIVFFGNSKDVLLHVLGNRFQDRVFHIGVENCKVAEDVETQVKYWLWANSVQKITTFLKSDACQPGLAYCLKKMCKRESQGHGFCMSACIPSVSLRNLPRSYKRSGESITEIEDAPGGGVNCCCEKVGVAVVAPSLVSPGQEVLVQVVGDARESLERAVKEAEEDDRENGARRRGKLMLKASRGQILAFEFAAKWGMVPDVGRQEIAWDGDVFNVRFMVHVAEGCETGAIPCKVKVFVDGIAVGRIAFMTNVVAKTDRMPSLEQRYAETTASPARNFFISYADKDYDAVLNYVEGIRVGSGGHMFFDKLSLERGDEWWSRICDYIDRKAEVFVLFWSENAAKSEYVRKEYLRALDNRAKRAEATTGGEFSRPEICPIVLSRPFPPPPAELEPYNFTDKLTFMRGAE